MTRATEEPLAHPHWIGHGPALVSGMTDSRRASNVSWRATGISSNSQWYLTTCTRALSAPLELQQPPPYRDPAALKGFPLATGLDICRCDTTVRHQSSNYSEISSRKFHPGKGRSVALGKVASRAEPSSIDPLLHWLSGPKYLRATATHSPTTFQGYRSLGRMCNRPHLSQVTLTGKLEPLVLDGDVGTSSWCRYHNIDVLSYALVCATHIHQRSPPTPLYLVLPVILYHSSNQASGARSLHLKLPLHGTASKCQNTCAYTSTTAYLDNFSWLP